MYSGVGSGAGDGVSSGVSEGIGRADGVAAVRPGSPPPDSANASACPPSAVEYTCAGVAIGGMVISVIAASALFSARAETLAVVAISAHPAKHISRKAICSFT